jgi:hypothetical protein
MCLKASRARIKALCQGKTLGGITQRLVGDGE